MLFPWLFIIPAEILGGCSSALIYFLGAKESDLPYGRTTFKPLGFRDYAYIWFNRLIVLPFISFLVVRTVWASEAVVWQKEDLDWMNGLASFLAVFSLSDFTYYASHRFVHSFPNIYKFVHKHHHGESEPISKSAAPSASERADQCEQRTSASERAYQCERASVPVRASEPQGFGGSPPDHPRASLFPPHKRPPFFALASLARPAARFRRRRAPPPHSLRSCPIPLTRKRAGGWADTCNAHPTDFFYTGFCTSPLSTLWLMPKGSVHIYAIGACLWINSFVGALGHCRLDLNIGVFNTRFHAGHHAYAKCNFAQNIELWDRLFGTYKDLTTVTKGVGGGNKGKEKLF
jgi:sterol desaturase/sphingolipid hydroxylase (fatty acid hydroxylase superfamily)